MKAFLEMYKNYVNFGGRTSRSEFWQAFMMNILVYLALWSISTVLGSSEELVDFNIILGLPSVYCLLTAIPVLAMMVRRLRDAGKSIANLLWSFLPFIGGIVLLVKLSQPSIQESNRR